MMGESSIRVVSVAIPRKTPKNKPFTCTVVLSAPVPPGQVLWISLSGSPSDNLFKFHPNSQKRRRVIVGGSKLTVFHLKAGSTASTEARLGAAVLGQTTVLSGKMEIA